VTTNSSVVWGRAARPLKRVHSGHPGDYVAWATVGVAVFGVLFALAVR
jgi:hypothetical protein